MKNLKRNLCIVLVMILCMSLLSGCVYESIEATINPNGSGTVKVVIGFEKELMDTLEALGADQTGTSELKETVIDGKTYLATDVSEDFESLDEFNELFGDTSSFTSEDTKVAINAKRYADDDFELSIYVELPDATDSVPSGTDESASVNMLNDYLSAMGMSLDDLEITDEQAQQLVDSMVMQVVITFPTQMSLVTGDDAITISGKTVKLNIVKALENCKDSTQYIVRTTGKYTDLTDKTKHSAFETKGFYDVNESAWYYDTVMTAVDMGLFNGTTTPDANGIGTFDPESNMTIAQFVTVIDRALGLEPVENATPWMVDPHWSDGYMRAAENAGIISRDTFNFVDIPIYRQEMAYILANAAKYNGVDIQKSISWTNIPDGKYISEEFKDGVELAYSAGLLTGVDSAGTFNPFGILNRAQGATVIVRLVNLLETR